MKLFKKTKIDEPLVDVSRLSLLDWKLSNEVQLQSMLDDALKSIENGEIDSAKYYIYSAISESKKVQYQIEYYLKD